MNILNLSAIMSRILTKKININFATLIILSLILALIYPTYNSINSKIQCGRVTSQYEKSIRIVSELDTKARNEWKSFPLYQGGYGGDARKPNGDGGRFYFNFESYFDEKYKYTSNSELRISQLLIVQNPKCFEPREVAEAQDYLDKVK